MDGVTNPYVSSPLASDPPLRDGLRRRPRIWTAFAVVLASLLTFMVASAVMFLVAIWVVHGGIDLQTFGDPDRLAEVTRSRIGFVIALLLPQLFLILPCLLAAWLSPLPFGRRLGLVRGHWPVWAWIGAMLATPLVGMSSGVVASLFMEESEHLKEIGKVFRDHGQSGFLIPMALMIGATPAICEELLFRGYLQTRLTRGLQPFWSRWTGQSVARWAGPAMGIFLASILFAAFHFDWVHVITVFPIGLFLGVVTYLSGSLFPAMLGHFLNNTLSVVIMVLAPEDATDTLALPSAMFLFLILAGGVTGLAATAIATVLYAKPANQPSPDPLTPNECDRDDMLAHRKASSDSASTSLGSTGDMR